MKYWTIMDKEHKPCTMMYGTVVRAKEFIDIVAYETLEGVYNYLEYANQCIEVTNSIDEDVVLPLGIGVVNIDISLHPQEQPNNVTKFL